MSTPYTLSQNFFANTNPADLIKEFGSPLYVYNEAILRQSCRDLKSLSDYPYFQANYSVKANGNLHLLRIIREEGFQVDAMSPGEIYVEELAGFSPQEILFISNNVSADEMRFAIERDILISVDSLAQLDQYGHLNPGGRVCIRFNPMVGAGHDDKVVTGGKNTKFGIDPLALDQVKDLLSKHKLNLVGINHHIGSLFMDSQEYLKGMQAAFELALHFKDLEFIDFGGGFGIPYHKQDGEKRLDLADLGQKIHENFLAYAQKYGKDLTFKIEPGRYLVAECGVLLGQVTSIKSNFGKHYLGTDLGFNVLQRPILYGSHHDIELYRPHTGQTLDKNNCKNTTSYQVVGNICESGDVLASDRLLPIAELGDIIMVLDTGAYGYCMASNYNNRLRPAEVLITLDGQVKLIRRADSLEDLVKNF